MASNVTPLRPRLKDRTAVERQRRFRANCNASTGRTVMMTTPEISGFAGELARGPVTPAHIALAEALLLSLLRLMPPGASPASRPENTPQPHPHPLQPPIPGVDLGLVALFAELRDPALEGDPIAGSAPIGALARLQGRAFRIDW